MLKMMIRMDDDKITTEKKYHLDSIYSTINNTFLTVGLSRIEDGSVGSSDGAIRSESSITMSSDGFNNSVKNSVP